MKKEGTKAAVAAQAAYGERRYVGRRETVGYILNDFADSFSIGKYGNRFIWDIVNIDFNIAGTVNLFTGAWDIINDTFIGANPLPPRSNIILLASVNFF